MRCRIPTAIIAIAAMLGIAPMQAEDAGRPYSVGVKQVEFVTQDNRPMWLAVFYPAAPIAPGAARLPMPFTIGIALYPDAPIVDTIKRRPLVMLSHGRGSDAWQYAWFAEALASQGYIVAALNHYRANTYDRDIAYLANRIWQRPIDVSVAINYLLADSLWGSHIDPERIGVAGHSQGGFTALWIGGARVNPEKFLAFQRRFTSDPRMPGFIRRSLPLDAAPALDVADKRVKAVFAMAPGIIQAFGMDPEGLGQLKIPAFLTVGASDTQTPPDENAAFAAKYIPNAQLWIIDGAVDHEIFTNECDQEGRNEFPESCIDRPGVDRHALHAQIAKAALQFFEINLSPR